MKPIGLAILGCVALFMFLILALGLNSGYIHQQVFVDIQYPQAVLVNGSRPLICNWNVGPYNITADYFIGNLLSTHSHILSSLNITDWGTYINQAVLSSSSPTFANLYIGSNWYVNYSLPSKIPIGQLVQVQRFNYIYNKPNVTSYYYQTISEMDASNQKATEDLVNLYMATKTGNISSNVFGINALVEYDTGFTGGGSAFELDVNNWNNVSKGGGLIINGRGYGNVGGAIYLTRSSLNGTTYWDAGIWVEKSIISLGASLDNNSTAGLYLTGGSKPNFGWIYIQPSDNLNPSTHAILITNAENTLQNFYVQKNGLIYGTNLTIGSLNGFLYATNGVVGVGTDTDNYENPLTFVSPLLRNVNTISLGALTLSHSNITDWGNYINQALLTSSSPNFVGLTLGSGTGLIRATAGSLGTTTLLLSDIPKGTLDYVLTGQGVGSDPIYAVLPSFTTKSKVLSFTRDCAAISGDVSYAGFGFKPNRLIVTISKASGHTVSTGGTGFTDSSKAGMCTYTLDAASNPVASDTSNFIHIEYWSGTGCYQTAVVKSYDTDGFTLTWTKVSTPTGIATLIFEAEL